MKLRLYIKGKQNGFTIVEVIIAVVVLSIFSSIIIYLYIRSNDSFKLTSWKQQRTAQSEIFWTYMRKHLEEATNQLDPEAYVKNPEVTIITKPLKFHPNPASVEDGNIMAWNCSKVNFDFSSDPPCHTALHAIFLLEKKGRTIRLKSDDKEVCKIEDVENIDIKVSSIEKDTTTNEEYLSDKPNPDAVASVIEISLTLSPPKGYLAEDLKLIQNHKFRANVGAAEDFAPSY